MPRSGRDILFSLGFDFPKSSEAYMAGQCNNNAEECEDNGDGSEPVVNVRCPVIQLFTSKIVDVALNFDFDHSKKRRIDRRVGLYGCVTLRVFLVVL